MEMHARTRTWKHVRVAVLVTFEDEAAMCAFQSSGYGYPNAGIIKTGMSEEDIAHEVQRLATKRGKVTLMTREFGRGQDFICYEEQISKEGGVVMIQTFLSDNISEEIQIRGRTARQKNIGTFVQIFCKEDLLVFDDNLENELQGHIDTNTAYAYLDGVRRTYFNNRAMERKDKVFRALALHNAAAQFRDKDIRQSPDQARNFLVKLNSWRRPGKGGPALLAMNVDASGSVSSTDFEKMRVFAGQVVDHLEEHFLAGSLEFALVQFSSAAYVEIEPTADLGLIRSTIRNFMRHNGGTSFCSAFEATDGVFSNRPDLVNRIVVFQTDGIDGDSRARLQVVLDKWAANTEQETNILAVGVGKGASRAGLELVASEPKEENVLTVEDYSRIGEKLGSIADHVADLITTADR